MDNQTLTWIIVAVVALLVIALVAWLVTRKRKSSQLQDRFGPEYERTVESSDNRRAAERDLRERAERREQLDIRPLDPMSRDRHAASWRQVQEQFVDRPAEAVTDAQTLVTRVMSERGYPVDDPDQQVKDLSVDHADVMDEFRSARQISELNDRKQATTEQLRQAMVHYRALFGRLLGDDHEGDGRDGRRRQTGDADPYPQDSSAQRSRERR
jgi:FtsZ-interacting cell division protein ZipA